MVTEAEARRVRPFMSGVVALVVALAAAIGWYYLGRPNESSRPVQTVEWKPWVKAGRADGKLLMVAPAALPNGWRAIRAEYSSGVSPEWQLALRTDKERFVGLIEARVTIAALVAKNIDDNATQGSEIEINGRTWQTWTDAGGDYALVRSFDGPDGNSENVIVFGGSAPDTQIRDFVTSLQIARDR